MFKHLLSYIVIAMFALPLFANNGDPEAVTLCSGEKMSWEMYQLNKKMLSYQYDMEVESVEFVSFTPAMINNQNGAWSSVINFPIIAAAAAHLPDGRIMTWSAKDRLVFGGDNGRTWTCIFDPSNNSVTEALVTNTGHDMFCPSASLLPDSRIMVNGGSSAGKTSIYDPMTGGWSSADDLNIPRGYHGGLTHASGATFVGGGSWSGAEGNKHAEVWTEKTGWYELPGVLAEVFTDGVVSSQSTKQDDYFPWLFSAPNGQIFHAGPSNKMHWIDPTGVGSWTQAGTRANSEYSTVGMSVMYDVGKILTLGGSTTFEDSSLGSKKCYTIDINSNNAVADETNDMSFGRAYGNTVVLPNGEVMAIGGQDVARIWRDEYAVLETEIWNPNTEQWRTVAPIAIPRSYHSTALLMLDGRVFVGGSGLCSTNCGDTNHPDAQIYTPPYLFNNNGGLASRPSITSAPTTTDWNTNMTVNTSSAVADFVFIKMTAVTHSLGNGQRRIPVNATNIGNNQYTLQIPSRHLLPPGNYMLFAINNNGVPSVAEVIKIGDDINDCTPQGHANLGGTGLQGTYYTGTNFQNEVLTRDDATINFNWGTGAPAAGMPTNGFSVRWEGNIKVPRDGFYTFFTNSDDGVRLWVNGRMMVDNWTDHGNIEDVGFVELMAGQSYDIKLEYYENTGGATIQLRWSGPGIDKSIIGSQYLFMQDPCDENDFDIVCEQNINDAGYTVNANCSIAVCTGDKLRISVNPNGFPTSWTGPNGFTSTSNAPLIANSINNSHYGNYIATIDINGCIKSETLSVTAGAGCDPCFGNGGDNDGDGICGNDDCNDNNANLPAPVGSGCNDGNSNTINDVIQSDGCTCEGEGVVNNNCTASYTVNGNSITFTGLTYPIHAVKIINSNFTDYWECNTWTTGCNSTETINNIPPGDYYISLNTYTATWNVICNIFESVTINGNTGGCTDNDNDGVCAADDCNDNNANVPAPVGSSCNDGNGNTTNDVIQSDGCTCQGTPVTTGCPVAVSSENGAITISGLLGANAKIFNTSWQEQWGCNPWTGTPCGNTETYNSGGGTFYVSVNSASCNFFEIVTVGGAGCTDTDNDGTCDSSDCAPTNPNLPAPVGSSCNDFNVNTNNDIIQSDGCTCEGTPIGPGGCSITYTLASNSITISGLSDPIVSAKVYDAAFNPFFDCGTFGTPCNQTETVNNLPSGDYVVIYQSFDSGWNQICNGYENVTLGNSPLIGTDNDELASKIANIKQATFVDQKIGKVDLYPNPATDFLNINLQEIDGNEVVVEIYNAYGQLVYSKINNEVSELYQAINLIDFNNGIYNLSIKVDDYRLPVKKFVVTK